MRTCHDWRLCLFLYLLFLIFVWVFLCLIALTIIDLLMSAYQFFVWHAWTSQFCSVDLHSYDASITGPLENYTVTESEKHTERERTGRRRSHLRITSFFFVSTMILIVCSVGRLLRYTAIYCDAGNLYVRAIY